MDRLEQCRRLLILETVELVYGGGDRERQERLRRQALRLKRRPGGRRAKRKRKDNMAWKKLVMPVRAAQRDEMAISASGRIFWSPTVHAAMGEPATVDVLYDPDEWLLGIRPAADEDGIKPLQGGRCVSAKKMLMAEGIWEDLQLPMYHLPAWEHAEGIWAVSVRPNRGTP